jgi:hypothetical protein
LTTVLHDMNCAHGDKVLKQADMVSDLMELSF